MENKRDYLQIELALLLKLTKFHYCPAKIKFWVGRGRIDARTEPRKKFVAGYKDSGALYDLLRTNVIFYKYN